MNPFAKWLDSMGQDPRTFPRDALTAVIRAVVVIWIVLLPVQIVMWATVPRQAAPGTVGTVPPLFWVTLGALIIYLPFAVLGAISYLGGWHRLSKRFPAPAGYSAGQLFGWQSATVGIANYNNVLKIRVGPQGLYLACLFPFTFMHPPILIPWTEIKAVRRKQYIFNSVLYLTVGSPKLATVMLVRKNVIAAAEKWLPAE